ncbi:MAG TPA: phosphatase PAP2 family protein [Rhodoblastus sp.]|nr:phosphatase PAP2 family protein [Rhodoblastus sp.]
MGILSAACDKPDKCAATSSARPGERALPFEYLLFALAVGGLAAGGVAIRLGLLIAPTSGLVVGDWYLLTSGLIIVAAAGSRRGPVLAIAGVILLVAAALYPALKLAGIAIEPKLHAKAAIAFASASAIAAQFLIGFRQSLPWRDNRDLAIACFAVALVITPLMSGWGIQISAIIPQTLDANALQMDEAFGVRVPAWLDGKIMASAAARYVVFHVYISISLAMVGYDLMAGDARDWRMTKLLLVSSFLGFVAYFITPTVGVVYFEGYGPSRAAADIMAQTSAAAATLPRNAMPSLHTTWGVMLIVAAVAQKNPGPWRRLVSALYAIYGVLTICGALTFGNHYLVDCIVALPFAATILLSFEPAATRAQNGFDPCFWAGVLLFAAWVAMLRIGGGLISQAMVLVMFAASVAHLAAAGILIRRARRLTPGWT